MKKTLAAAAVILTLCTPAAHAAHAVRLQGAVDCGEWIRQQSSVKETVDTIYNRAWLLGFMSGYIAPGTHGDPFSSGLSTDQVYVWMDNYCRANPLSFVANGAVALIRELQAPK
ncbi:hypothetical protein [Cupriavidus sp. BIS7]|uniref:hypothetical protein n=1 Tax=Cupriavidus sp. BIS7 TaxID=1217718 RepID=UPI00035EF713|nr:hypothetical protein [Cupriavidus sp. BIS7]